MEGLASLLKQFGCAFCFRMLTNSFNELVFGYSFNLKREIIQTVSFPPNETTKHIIMDNEATVEVGATQENTNEGGGEATVDTIAIPKSEYEKMNQTLGSLKRELKDLKKPKEESSKETESKPNESNGLLEKAFLRSAQITHPEDVELALATAKKWGVTVDALVDDPDFQLKLEKSRTTRSNVTATSNIRGGSSQSNAKNTPAYWQALGKPPTAADVPDRKVRANIARDMMKSGKNGKKFYND